MWKACLQFLWLLHHRASRARVCLVSVRDLITGLSTLISEPKYTPKLPPLNQFLFSVPNRGFEEETLVWVCGDQSKYTQTIVDLHDLLTTGERLDYWG